jgi:glycosyltransferase involved in cell wall biosynthesis
MVLLYLADWLVNHAGFEVATLFRAGGPLVRRFAEHGPVSVMTSRWDREVSRRLPGVSVEAAYRCRRLRAGRTPFNVIYSNTLTNGRLMRTLSAYRIPIITHVHELRFGSRTYTSEKELEQVLSRTARFVAAAQCVKDFLEEDLAVRAPIDVVHEFIPTATLPAEVGPGLRAELGIEPGAPIVGGAGSVDWRKGDDLFIQVAHRVLKEIPSELHRPHFVWLGGPSGSVARAREEVEKAGIADHCHFVGERADPISAYQDYDVFLLTSREDAYPLVVLENAALGKPIIGFGDSGGFLEFAESGHAVTVPYLDVDAMAHEVIVLLSSESRRSALGLAARDHVRKTSDVSVGAPRIAEIIASVARSREVPLTRSP